MYYLLRGLEWLLDAVFVTPTQIYNDAMVSVGVGGIRAFRSCLVLVVVVPLLLAGIVLVMPLRQLVVRLRVRHYGVHAHAEADGLMVRDLRKGEKTLIPWNDITRVVYLRTLDELFRLELNSGDYLLVDHADEVGLRREVEGRGLPFQYKIDGVVLDKETPT